MSCAATFVLEVMDKELPLRQVLAVFLGMGLVGMLCCRKWPLTFIVIFPLLALVAIAHIAELNAPSVGEAIRAEAGVRYVVWSYLAIGSSFALLAIGTFQGWARSKNHAKSN